MEPIHLTQTVKRACKGDPAAQSLLYQRYSRAMFNICIRMTASQKDAEDLLQDAFVKAFCRLQQLNDPLKFGGWLKVIVINECIHFLKGKMHQMEWTEERINSIVDNETCWWDSISLEVIHNTIKTLPDGCREVFNLFVIEDFSHKKIALYLNISESTSKSQYHRARQLLKERISVKIQ